MAKGRIYRAGYAAGYRGRSFKKAAARSKLYRRNPYSYRQGYNRGRR